MFSLLYGLFHWYFTKTERAVLILGLDSAGKTVEVGSMRLLVWDLGGQRGLRSIWDKYFDSADALVYVVDACDRHRFNEATQTLESVLARPELAEVPVLVLANKQDRGPQQAAHPSELEQLCLAARRDRPFVRFAGVSALTGEGVAASLEWLCDVLARVASSKPRRSVDK